MAIWDDVQLVILVLVLVGLAAGYGLGRRVTRFVCARIGSRTGQPPGAAPPAGERPPTPGVVVWESLYNNKLLAGLLVLVVLIAYGQVFRTNGIPALFWQQSILGQWAAGFGVGLLIIELFYATYIVDGDSQDNWARATVDLAGLTPARRLWAFLATTTFPFFVVVALPAILPYFRPKSDGNLPMVIAWPWLMGLLAAVLLIGGVIVFRVRASILWWRSSGPLRQGPTRRQFLAQAEQDIGYANSASLLLIFLGIYVTSYVIGPAFFSNAGLLICVFLGLVAAFYAALASSRRRYQLMALVLVAWGLFANSDAYKLRFPNMDYNAVVVLEPVPDEIATKAPPERHPHPRVILNRWLRYVRAEGSQAKSEAAPAARDKPKLVLVSVSGGAIRAATWAAVVLTELERQIPGFERHLRVITGASGGMLGAAYFTTTLHEAHKTNRPPVEYHKRIVDDLSGRIRPDGGFEPHDFLTPVVAQMVLRDIPEIFIAHAQDVDRGRALEKAWDRWTDRSLSTPLAELAEAENHGRLPSIIFSPMIVEDGRRLLISNLGLEPLTMNRASRVSEDRVKPNGLYSRSAVEFSRLFPGATGFTVATAVRMNASFPYVSPAVSLPTNPPRRVVDAGYYDNYGVDLAASWIMQNGEWLAENTSGVVLIQVRAFTNEEDLRDLTNPVAEAVPARAAGIDDGTPANSPGASPSIADRLTGILARGTQFLTAPIDGFSSARTAINYYRNDEQVKNVDAWFRARMHSPTFFTSVIFTCSDRDGGVTVGGAANAKISRSLQEETLSWTIGLDEKLRIATGMARTNNVERLENLKRWWRDPHLRDAQGRATATQRRARVAAQAAEE